MARTNGKSEIEPRELDTEHELPAADDATPPASCCRDEEIDMYAPRS